MSIKRVVIASALMAALQATAQLWEAQPAPAGPSAPANTVTARCPKGDCSVSQDRRKAIIEYYLRRPAPQSPGGDPALYCNVRIEDSLAALSQDSDISVANAYLQDMISRYSGSFNGSADPDRCSEAGLYRIVGDPVLFQRLTPAVQSGLLAIMQQLLYQRERLIDLRNDWFYSGTENIDAGRRAHYLVAAEALVANGRGNFVLADGATVTQHAQALERHWQRYFREHAREGISCEIASTYNVYTLADWFLVRDLADDTTTKELADKFLTLFFADAAHDFVPAAGERAGAYTRLYKNTQLRENTDPIRELFYLYQWDDTVVPTTRSHFLWLIAALSTYETPAVVRAIAKTSSSYVYTAARFGVGHSVGERNAFAGWQITFDAGGNSDLLRQIFVTPEYKFGALVDDETMAYSLLIGQNKAMGAIFSDGSRMIVHDKGAGGGGCTPASAASPLGCVTDHNGIFGVAAQNVLIVGRDPKAGYAGPTRLFVSTAMAASAVSDPSGWIIFTNGLSYAAARVVNGEFTATRVSDGVMYDAPEPVNKIGMPIVVQFATSKDYPSASAFRQAVVARQARYRAANYGVAYKSLNGDTIELFADNRAIPRLNGRTVELNPHLTYDSPFMKGVRGTSVVELSADGYHLMLDFGQ